MKKTTLPFLPSNEVIKSLVFTTFSKAIGCQKINKQHNQKVTAAQFQCQTFER